MGLFDGWGGGPGYQGGQTMYGGYEGPSVRPYEPTWRDRIAGWMLGDERPSVERRNMVEGLLGSSGTGSTGMGVADFTPAGIPFAVDEAAREAQQGNYGMAAVTAAGAILPGAGKAGKPIAKGAAKGAKKVAGLLDDAAENSRAVVGHNMPPPDMPPPEPSMYDIPPGSDPRYLGAAPDRTDHSLLRFDPPRGVSARTTDALAALRENRNGIKDQLLADIKRGEGIDGSSWYNTEELRDWFVKELGEERGDAEWRDYMRLIGATSTGSKVPANIGNASYYRNRGPEWIRENADRLKAGKIKDQPDLVPPKGYGHKMMDNHAANAANLYTGGWDEATAHPTLNPKPRGFTQSLLGSGKNIAADLHFTRYMAMASGSPEWLDNTAEISGELATRLRDKYGPDVEKYFSTRSQQNGKEIITFKPKAAVKAGAVDMADIADEPTVYVSLPNDNEYKAFEDYMHELGKELGMTGPQVQANLWMGAAQRTGLADESQGTFMDLFRRRADERAKVEKFKPAVDPETGRTVSPREQIIRRFIRERGLLAIPGAAGGAALYGAGGGQPAGLLDDRSM